VWENKKWQGAKNKILKKKRHPAAPQLIIATLVKGA
jgi:hypothetical protein